MKPAKILFLTLAALALSLGASARTGTAGFASGTSVYTQRPDDSEAFYFTPENYDIKPDGRTDVSDGTNCKGRSTS